MTVEEIREALAADEMSGIARWHMVKTLLAEVDSLRAAREQDRLYIQRLLAPTPTTDEIRDKFRGNETGLCRALIFHANQQERRLAVADAALAEARERAQGWEHQSRVNAQAADNATNYRKEVEAQLAALIDAKLAPLVEDRARETERLDWILEHLYAAPILIGDYYLCPQMNGIGRGKTKRAAIDQARAQRPAQEGSDKT